MNKKLVFSFNFKAIPTDAVLRSAKAIIDRNEDSEAVKVGKALVALNEDIQRLLKALDTTVEFRR